VKNYRATAFFVAGSICLLGFSAKRGISAADEREPGKSVAQQSATHLEVISSPGSGIADRAQAILGLGCSLQCDEINILYRFLRAHEAEENIAALHYFKNEVLNSLRNQETPPKNLTETMIAIYWDRQQDETMRDYAIQHLAAWYEDGAEDAPDAKQKIREILVQVAEEKSVLGATALLNLHQLSQNDSSSFDANVIDKLALQMATVSDTPVPSRVTAFQVCAERRISAALPAIESALSDNRNAILRASAIAAIGELGRPPQIALLRSLQTQKPALHGCLQSALKRFEERKRNELF
jgi:hypothetical protein